MIKLFIYCKTLAPAGIVSQRRMIRTARVKTAYYYAYFPNRTSSENSIKHIKTVNRMLLKLCGIARRLLKH